MLVVTISLTFMLVLFSVIIWLRFLISQEVVYVLKEALLSFEGILSILILFSV